MTEQELRSAFTRLEALIPGADGTRERIVAGIAARRRRIRWTVALGAGAAAAVLLVAAMVPAALSWRRAAPVVANTPEPTTAPRADDPLVTAPPVTVTIPLTPGWLPPGLTKVDGRAELFGSQQRECPIWT